GVLLRTDLLHHLVEGVLLRRQAIVDRVRLVVGNVHIEAAVTVHVGQRDRRPPSSERAQSKITMLGEMTFPVVDENRVRTLRREEDEVERAIAVDIRERDAGRVAIAGTDPRALGDVLKAPVSKILIERAASFGAAEEDVRQPVTVHVAQRDTGALPENPVPEQRAVAHEVLEVDAGLLRRHPRKARRTATYAQLAPAISGLLMPLSGLRLATAGSDDQTENPNPERWNAANHDL